MAMTVPNIDQEALKKPQATARNIIIIDQEDDT